MGCFPIRFFTLSCHDTYTCLKDEGDSATLVRSLGTFVRVFRIDLGHKGTFGYKINKGLLMVLSGLNRQP